MDCERYKLIFTAFLDNDLNKEEKADFLAHIEKCPSCKAELEEIRALLKDLHELSHIELPEGYHDELMEKLHRQQQQVRLFMEKTPSAPAKKIMQVHPKKVVKIPFFRRLAGAMAYTFAALMIVSATGLMLFGENFWGTKDFIVEYQSPNPEIEQTTAGYGTPIGMFGMDNRQTANTGSDSGEAVSQSSMESDSEEIPPESSEFNLKMALEDDYDLNNNPEVQTVDVTGNTAGNMKKTAEYKLSTGNVPAFVTHINSMFESMNLTPNVTEQNYYDNNNTYFTTVSIPNHEYDNFKKNIETLAANDEVILSVEEYSNDNYRSALISQINIKQTEEQRIKNILSVNNTNVADTIALENRLSELNYDIIDLQGQINLHDDSVSTVRLFVSENPAAMDLPSQIGLAFNESAEGTLNFFKEFILFWVRASIPLLLIAVIFLPIFIYRHYYKVKNKTG